MHPMLAARNVCQGVVGDDIGQYAKLLDSFGNLQRPLMDIHSSDGFAQSCNFLSAVHKRKRGREKGELHFIRVPVSAKKMS